MTDHGITLYPGDSLTIYASEGQAPESAGDEPTGEDTSTAPAGDTEPAGAVVQDADPQSVGVVGEDETPEDSETAQG